MIGRASGCGIIVDSPSVSRRHAHLRTIAGDTIVEDLRSRHGTFVNAAKIAGPTVLHLGDRLVVGDVVFMVVRAAEASQPPAAPGAKRVVPSGERTTDPQPATDLGHDAFGVFVSVAAKALAAGRIRQATAVAQHLYESMTRAGHTVPEAAAQIDTACDLFARITVATEGTEWLDRVFELRLAFGSRMSAATMKALATIAREVPVPPQEVRHAYVGWMRRQPLPPAERAALDELATAGS